MTTLTGMLRSAPARAGAASCTLLLLTLLFIITGALSQPLHKVVNQLLILLPLIFTLAQVRRSPLRNALACLPLLLIALHITLSLFAWCEYGTPFSYGFALSILNSDWRESCAMMTLYYRWGVVFLLLLGALFGTVNLLPRTAHPRFSKLPPLLLLTFVAAYSLQAVAHTLRKNATESLLQRIVADMPFSNLNGFLQAARDKAIIAQVSQRVPHYDLTLTDTPVNTWVLVIGESARAGNMSLYGYPRDTTPQLRQASSRLLLFSQAIAGAPVTATAVPLALSADRVERHDIDAYADNIINIANQAGLKTFWFSKQGMYGDYSNAITGIAMNAAERQWLSDDDDGSLLPALQRALAQPGKKLIVLHLYGSHEPACIRYPQQQAVFTVAGDKDACYDNSIRYTDTLLGQIFSQLRGVSASLLYFSDHGLERHPQERVVYRHGGVHPSQAAYQVPMFIWYSPAIAATNLTGTVAAPWSTVDNYQLMQRWLGVRLANADSLSLKQWVAVKSAAQQPVQVMDTTGKVYRFSELAPEKRD
ncbi:phosphoethanolamine transferase [Mixta gaviniae]|uniref:Sulfatase n=1 Tax=Mixta gaviniae TaxID=665914 RepID=A0A2L0IDB1_9GAMM|nr:phosphoethanolamine transferase [Mixta gaviniae]AUX92588.1 sulfatase [Mixta gaviniae]